MTEEFQLNDDIYTGTKEVSENLKFESKLLQEWINDNVKDSGNIEKIEQFKGGQSNPTYKISTENNAYVLRRKPPGKLLPKAHAVDREYKVITALYETDVPVPKTYGLCEDDSVVGTPFFLMECVDGTVYWDHMLPKCSPEERELIYKNKNKVIASLHSVDYKEVGLEDYGKSGNYVARHFGRKMSIDKMIRVGASATIIGISFAIALQLAGIHDPFALFAPIAIATFGNGITLPNAQAAAINEFPQFAGSASGLTGFLQMSVSAIAAQLVAFIFNGTVYPLLLLMLAAALLSLFLFNWGVGRPSKA